MAEEKNVILLVLDSLRKDRTGIYNDEVDFTPHLQSIADESKVFENAISQAPWTLPSHVSMFTGEYPWEHGVGQSRTYMKDETETFIQDLSDEGFHCAAITSNVWITPHKNTTKDFDYVENFLGKKDNFITVNFSKLFNRVFDSLSQDTKKKAEKYIDSFFQFFEIDDSCKSEETIAEAERYLSNREDENFFLYLNLMEPHEPYHPPEEYLEKHGVEDRDKIAHRQKDLFTKDISFSETRKAYDASVDYTDQLVGRLRDCLEENSLTDDTVLVVISDHGQALGEDDLFGHQFTVHDKVIDTVMMIDHPDEESGTEEGIFELRKLHDLIPYYAGIEDEPEEKFSEKARGAYQFPSIFIGYVPDELMDKYYKKMEYIKDRTEKTVKETKQDGEETFKTIDLETGEEKETGPEKKREINNITQPEPEEREEEKAQDEEIKKRLEDLGYG